MTVSTDVNRVQYTGNGATATFSTGSVVFYDTSDLVVTETVIATGVDTEYTITTDYTVTGGDGEAGSITLTAGNLPSTKRITIERAIPYTQSSDFVEGETILAEEIETSLDKIVIMAQQLSDAVERSVKLPSTTTASSITLPSYSADAVLTWSSSSTDTLINSTKTLTDIEAAVDAYSLLTAGVAGTLVSSGDIMAGFLEGKLLAGANISLTKGNAGGNETLTAALSGVVPVTSGGTGQSTVSGVLDDFQLYTKYQTLDAVVCSIILADEGGTAGRKGLFYLADPFTSDTLATSTNATYSGSDDWYASDSVSGSDSATSGQHVGSGFTDTANLYDGDNSTVAAGSATPVTDDNYIGQNFGSAVAIASITLDQNFTGTDQYITSVFIKYSDNGTDWTTDSTHSVDDTSGGNSLPVTTGGRHQYWAIFPNDDSTNNAGAWRVEALKMYQSTGADVTLRPTAQTLDTADPDEVTAYFRLRVLDTDIIGDEVTGSISIDGGSNYDEGTFTKIGEFGDDELWRLVVDTSARTGSSLLYSLESTGSVRFRLVQCGGLVPTA